jgi:hypothetical protein
MSMEALVRPWETKNVAPKQSSPQVSPPSGSSGQSIYGKFGTPSIVTETYQAQVTLYMTAQQKEKSTSP